jgi:hypothetical protein
MVLFDGGGKPCIKPSACGSVSVAVWLDVFATDMKAGSGEVMRES